MTATDANTEAAGRPVAEAVTADGDGTEGDCEDTLDIRLADEPVTPFTPVTEFPRSHGDGEGERWDADPEGDEDTARRGELLDHPATWSPATTRAGVFRLVPVRLARDLSLISRWMNDPAVAQFWELAGPPAVTEAHLLGRLAGDGRSVPCLGVLDDVPMSYWEIYRADLDPLARHYPARPHDTGIHLLVGPVADRGRGLGSTLLSAVVDLVLDHRPSCARVVAEPDLRNTPSVAAFLSAGFRFFGEIDLPGKRAALMVCDRALRPVLRPGPV